MHMLYRHILRGSNGKIEHSRSIGGMMYVDYDNHIILTILTSRHTAVTLPSMPARVSSALMSLLKELPSIGSILVLEFERSLLL
jgi:hypothetical protein